jgi:putative salt-induced outer membrane protein YdiY/small nuclear ribonucleoprotein (snRNP)-like protein
MHLPRTSQAFLALVIAMIFAAQLSADVVETKNGARIVGKVTKIDGSLVVMDTDYAGTIKIKQSEVTAIVTEAPVTVRLTTGTPVNGRISGADGTLQIAGPEGTTSTNVAKIAAFWVAGAEDPAVAALRRKWSYEASIDMSGTSGNQDQLGTAGAFRATLANSKDALALYTAYNRQVTAGAKSADQFKAGVDYADNFNDRTSWYARDEGGFDRIKDLGLYNTAAAGFGYDFIKQPKHTLTLRAGFSYQYENYNNPLTTDVNSAGLDFGLNHEFQFGTGKLVNRLTYDPGFEDFTRYNLTHESFYEVPLASPAWKLRLGVSNDYNSEPSLGVKKLDTAYFTRLLLNWK